MDYVVESLKEGKLVVEICEAYTITGGSSGHFIVLTGVTTDGHITMLIVQAEKELETLQRRTIKSYGRDLSEGAFWIIGKQDKIVKELFFVLYMYNFLDDVSVPVMAVSIVELPVITKWGKWETGY